MPAYSVSGQLARASATPHPPVHPTVLTPVYHQSSHPRPPPRGLRDLFGEEPAYEKQPEDRAGWLLGTFFHTWLGDLMQRAAREELTMDGLPRPMREYRAYNAGVALSAELQRQRARRHAWDGYVGARVGVRWDDASDGVLRWVGAVQQYGTPGRLYAGVEWRVAPSQRRGCCVRRCMGWLLCRGCSAPVPEQGPGAHHRGEVDGEHLFDPVDENTVLTCERVDDVVFRPLDRYPAGAVPPPGFSTEDAKMCEAPQVESVLYAVFYCFRKPLLWLLPLRFVVELSALLTPMARKWYVGYLAPPVAPQATTKVPPPPIFHAFCSVAVVFCVSLVNSVTTAKYEQLCRRYAFAARSALSSCIAAKCLLISEKSVQRPELNAGRIVNLVASDVEVLVSAFQGLWMIVTIPVLLVATVCLLYRTMGFSALVGVGLMMLIAPLQILATIMSSRCSYALALATDERLRTTNEFLSGIRAIKFMGFERHFQRLITEKRDAELAALRRFQIATTGTMFATSLTPILTLASTFITYALTGHAMSPHVVYPVISLLQLIHTPQQTMFSFLVVYAQFFVSMKRLTSFLAADDAQARDILEAALASKEGDDAAAVLRNATVSSYKAVPLPPASSREGGGGDTHYELRAKTLLADVDLRVPRGRLTVVLGPTGSGKSTLLDALIGALAVTRGRVACSRSVAYVPQQPWTMNATLRDNVIFFGAPDAAAFERAVRSSQLASDLALLADGAETEIGENGINLSGGQKARVSLARAVYADRDVYLLDDPLSALDAQVGERVMRECVCGALAGKTRVLATHQVSAAAYADLVVLLEEGRVAFQGNYAAYCEYARQQGCTEEMAETVDNCFASETVDKRAAASRICAVLSQAMSMKSCDTADRSAAASKQRCDVEGAGNLEQQQEEPRLLDDAAELAEAVEVFAEPTDNREEKASGAVTWSMYRRYIHAAGGMHVFCGATAVFLLTEVAQQLPTIWLSLWSSGALEGVSNNGCIVVFTIFALSTVFVIPVRVIFVFNGLRDAARGLHSGLLSSLVVATLNFYETTPLGRLTNRLSRDMREIDAALPTYVISAAVHGSFILGYLLMLTVSQPFTVFLLVPCILVYGHIFVFFCAANREMQRLLNISNSPVFSILNEVLTGRWLISTYGRENAVVARALQGLDSVFACAYMKAVGTVWVTVRVELLGNASVCVLALLGVLSTHIPSVPINAAILALCFINATSLSQKLSSLIGVGATVEASMNCVERVLYYTDNAPAEELCDENENVHPPKNVFTPAVVDAIELSPDDASAATAPAGSLVLEHVDMRYRPGLPLVLRDVCFAVAPGQKVGVVGRTGSGKSTLLLAFLRLVEVCGGRMLVCGRDARDYGVRELRRLFSTIPQDPLLFEGTVRSNVDPFGCCGDAAVWRALRQVGMEERVRGEAGGLDGRVQEGGANYSVGQRQLLCLARALLKRGSAFLLMDEATANVDPALDRQIQRTVQHTFRDYTVVTIAHRLHTVAACDVILVMDQGRVLEFGSPRDLLSRGDSVFSVLVCSLSKGSRKAFYRALKEGVAG
ncbi:ATP-binding cassette protein subfamily C, member 6 [Leishmania infantum JPCM5]|uniref:ATP-binding cassette protein subfamily C, member 6 n=1 Tax=Leishmania infantum TaxID=5671 RepID=A4I6Q5_LEIIN|nr:ATP-binding cassette protein subfamily C, member 6 [Leishmania infantum JPCM5]CAM70482.1 ATP-binding cassette protein subfamily C, member 6 [Leishmania infantum JPCM5]|eukprot:XP_001467424.1 ATP-binding cassette protein subfamily C, member 6 [Leishmania infantum JPCM5]